MRRALALLGIDRLVLAVHDASFPAGVGEDVGRGSPYSRASRAFFDFLAGLGFDAVQLGPQGKISLGNPSPYDGAVMARSHLSVALAPLVEESGDRGYAGLLSRATFATLLAATSAETRTRAQHKRAWPLVAMALAEAEARYARTPVAFAPLAEVAPTFLRANEDWLLDDELFEAIVVEHGSDDVASWPAVDRTLHWPPSGGEGRARARRLALAGTHATTVGQNRFTQLLLHVQHQELRADLRRMGLSLFADFQVGLSSRDRWRHAGLLLPGYALGAPPSRTNPEGQPWGYPVLDPDHLGDGRGDAGLRFFERRLERAFADFDGLRLDHPHGLIAPWIYRRGDGPPDTDLPAVRAGARLFESPDLPDHPELARYAIATRADLAPWAEARPRYADDWVRTLTPAQIDRYAILVDRVMAAARRHGARAGDVCAEVLSTCPFPVARVLARHGLGRVRVVQKADPDDTRDPYRSENAAEADWITLGTHDTSPVAPLLDGWRDSGRAAAWARYLAQRLGVAAEPLAGDRRRLLDALTADLFLGPARHVQLFFTDLFGMHDRYNLPGTVDAKNWTLRVPPDFTAAHARGVESGDALDLRAALALALDARAAGAAGEARDLAQALRG